MNDLAELFGDDWAWVGVGRDDGVAKGEFNPIFYKKYDPPLLFTTLRNSLGTPARRSAFELVSNDTFWLS